MLKSPRYHNPNFPERNKKRESSEVVAVALTRAESDLKTKQVVVEGRGFSDCCSAYMRGSPRTGSGDALVKTAWPVTESL